MVKIVATHVVPIISAGWKIRLATSNADEKCCWSIHLCSWAKVVNFVHVNSVEMEVLIYKEAIAQ